jgi:hypothetical protein
MFLMSLSWSSAMWWELGFSPRATFWRVNCLTHFFIDIWIATQIVWAKPLTSIGRLIIAASGYPFFCFWRKKELCNTPGKE